MSLIRVFDRHFGIVGYLASLFLFMAIVFVFTGSSDPNSYFGSVIFDEQLENFLGDYGWLGGMALLIALILAPIIRVKYIE